MTVLKENADGTWSPAEPVQVIPGYDFEVYPDGMWFMYVDGWLAGSGHGRTRIGRAIGMRLARWRHRREDVDTTPTVIADVRVADCEGGGACPEQWYGNLIDGRPFYFRMRHSWAELHVGRRGETAGDLPAVNPLWDKGAFDAAVVDGVEYPHPFFRPPVGHYRVYPDAHDVGYFLTANDRDRAFTACLNDFEALSTGADAVTRRRRSR